MSTSQFLALPGELRNRIYELCVEPKAIRLLRMPKLTKKPYENACSGLYGSLRNVSEQTRAEFGPMYMAKTVLIIHQVTANTFLRTFYPELRQYLLASELLQPGRVGRKLPAFNTSALSAVQGNIQIITYFGQRYDATLLVRLCAKYPAFKVNFTDASACLDLASLLNDFFTSILSGNFRPNMDRVFQRIEITCSTLPEIRCTPTLGGQWRRPWHILERQTQGSR